MAQKLKFGNGTWATKKGSTLAYNDENNNYKPLPFTTTRDSIATRVNKEGLIEVVGNDVPRIDYTDSADGALLLEPTRSNYDSESTNFSTSFMSNSAGIQSSSLVSNIAPDDSINSVYKISKVTDNSDPYIGRSGVSFTNTSMVFSVWLWTDENQPKDVLFLVYRDGVQEVQTKNITLTTTPTRYFIEASFTTTPSNVTYRIDLTPNSSNQYIYAWGKQLESGSYATSYIPTNGSAVTRQADTASGAGNDVVFNDSEGVLFFNLNTLDTSSVPVFSLSDGTFSNEIEFAYYGTNQWNVISRVGGANTSVVGTVNGDAYSKFSVSYTSSNFKVFLNGFLIGSNTMASAFSGLKKINFSYPDEANPFQGKTKEIGYYDEILTDLELETLTSYRSLNELVTELNLNEL